MYNSISRLTSCLSEVNSVLSSAKAAEDITLARVSVLANFLLDFHNTCELVLKAEENANKDLEKLSKDNSSLIKELDTFQSMDLTLWESFDYETLVTGHLKPFEDEWKRLKSISTKSNKSLTILAYSCRDASRDSERYQQLYLKVQRAVDKCFKASRKADEAYELLRKEEMRCAGVYYFHFGIFKSLLSEIKEIADCIELDIEVQQKESRHEE